MSLVLESYPDEYHTVANPVVYRFQRKDVTLSGFADNAGNMSVNCGITGSGLSDLFAIGDTCYVESNTFLFTAEVTAVNTGTGYVTFDYAYFSTSETSGFANLITKRPNYKASVYITDTDAAAIVQPYMTFSPNSTGDIVCDVSSILRANTAADQSTVLPTSITRDTNKTLNYTLSYGEQWTGHAVSSYTTYSTRYGIFAATQVLKTNSMSNYVLGSAIKKLLTSFSSFVKKRGIYHSVSILLNPDIGNDVWQWESGAVVEWESGADVTTE